MSRASLRLGRGGFTNGPCPESVAGKARKDGNPYGYGNARDIFSALDTAVEVLTVAVGVAVLLFGWRILPGLSFFLHRRAVWVFSFAAVLFLLSEFVEMVEALLGQSKPVVVESWITVVAKDVTELLVMACIGVGVYLLYRAGREEISLLKRSADIDELTNLSKRSCSRRATMRRFELSRDNDIPLACALIDVDGFQALQRPVRPRSRG